LGEFLPYKWKILNSGELLPYKWRILNSERADSKIFALFLFIPKKGSIMEEFKLYSISDEYVEWLREDFPNVYSNKVNARS